MVKLIEIVGAEISSVDVESFSPADIVAANDQKMEDYRRDLDDPSDDVVGISVGEVKGMENMTFVTLFNSDGETRMYIGPTNHFVMDPPLDEEPAYDNYI